MYAIMIDYFHCNTENNFVFKVPCYLGVNHNGILVWDAVTTERTKLFKTAEQTGKYLDSHFTDEDECYGNSLRIVKLYSDF